ncbi:hypothetical protein A6C57_25645 [Fibrella sp. ES10-3-2-2]|nr:hypothetical protein A6C57_25645 [Fibrella sp. ES10-3-2-2]
MLKKYIEQLKENLSLITIVPLLLGGIWQVVLLSTISPSYIRFFSVSQQISDGVLILFVSAFIYIIFLFGKKSFIKSIDISYFENSSKWHLMFVSFGCLVVLAGVSLYLLVFYYYPYSKGEKLYFGDILAFLFFTVFLLIAFGRLFSVFAFLYIKKRKSVIDEKGIIKIVDNLIPVLALLLLIIPAFVVVVSITKFHDLFNMPDNLKNMNYVIDKYCKDYKSINRDSVKVLYMNDKYLFIKDSSKIEIVKFDYMFKDSK